MVAGIVGGFLADYAFNLTLSRLFPPHEYGDFKVAYAFAFTCSVVVLLGGDRAAPKFLSTALAAGDNRVVWEYLWFYLRIALALSAIIVVLTTIATVLHIGPADPEHHHPLFHISFTIPLIAIVALLSRVLQAAKFLGPAVLSVRVGLPVLETILVVTASFFMETVTLLAVIVLAAAAVVVVGIWQWRRVKELNLVSIERHPELLDPKEALAVSVPMMAAMLVVLALTQVDLFMFEALGGEHEVGHFAAAATTAHLVILAQVTIVGLFAPLVAPAMAAGVQASRELFWRAQKLIVFSSIPLAGSLLFFGGDLLSLFGEGFDGATAALQILTLGYLVSALAALSSVWLQYSGKGQAVVAISLGALLIDAVCNYLWIPIHGLSGAASATAAAMFVAAIATWFVIYRHADAHQ